MPMLLYFGFCGAVFALAGAFVIVVFYAGGTLIWEAVAYAFAAGYGWFIWTVLAIAGTGFLGGVIFPFVIPPPKDQPGN